MFTYVTKSNAAKIEYFKFISGTRVGGHTSVPSLRGRAPPDEARHTHATYLSCSEICCQKICMSLVNLV